MNFKDQVSFSDAVRTLSLADLERVREILLCKKMTNDNYNKLKLIDIEIEEKYRRKDYMEKL